MSLCDMEIFKTAVVQKLGPIKLGHRLICHEEPLVNYNKGQLNYLNDLYIFHHLFCSVQI